MIMRAAGEVRNGSKAAIRLNLEMALDDGDAVAAEDDSVAAAADFLGLRR